MINEADAINLFIEKHTLSCYNFEDCEIREIKILEQCHEQIRIQQPNILKDEVVWKTSQFMLEKIYEKISGAMILVIFDQSDTVEIIARAAVENTVDLLYILKENPIERIIEYLRSYIEKEKKKNEVWSELLDNKSDNYQFFKNYSAISEQSVGSAEIFIKQLAEQWRIGDQRRPWIEQLSERWKIEDERKPWPETILERFKAIGKEFEYRTFYKAVCGTVHGNAMDLIDSFDPENDSNLDKSFSARIGKFTIFGVRF